MTYQYFSHNGEILPIEQAVVPLSNVEYSYGFGVYESIRLANGKLLFVKDHCQRLLNSARIIDLEHQFQPEIIENYIKELIDKNRAETCNIKLLLIGGRTAETAELYILCLNPLFPDSALYKRGVECVTYHYERDFPNAKTLNMLPSYLA